MQSPTVVLQTIENTQRVDLTAWEKARAIEAWMKETGGNATQAAGKLGFSNGTITKWLSVLSLPEALQQKIRAGELPATSAYDLARVADPEKQNQLAQRMAEGELTRDALSSEIKSRKRNGHKRKNSARRCLCVKARLPGRQSVTVSAPNLDLNTFVAIVEALLTHARAAHSEGLSLDALLEQLKQLSRDAPKADRAQDSGVSERIASGSRPSEIGQAV
jgi:ParB-like chromosome segregation protein Spo0J